MIDLEITDECFACCNCEYEEECHEHSEDEDFIPMCAYEDEW